MSLIWLFTSPLGRLAGGLLFAITVLTGSYMKGRMDGKSSCEKEISQNERDILRQGIEARDHQRRFDDDPERLLHSDGFRRE